MTYIKPDAVPDQLSWVKEILGQGTKAAQVEDWPQVVEQIKLLPQAKTGSKSFVLSPDDWQQGWELALQVLLAGDFAQRWEIAKIMPLFGSVGLPMLCELVVDQTLAMEVRWFSCKILASFPQPETVLALVELLQQAPESELIDAAAKTLVSIGDDAITALVELLPESDYRLLAVQSLSLIRTSATVAPLLQVAQDPDAELRTIAIKALGSFHDERIAPLLIKALQDPASSVRKVAIQALSFRPELCRELGLVAQLTPLLGDINLDICAEAAIALGRMKQHGATEALFAVWQRDTTPDSLKSELIKALGRSEIAAGISFLKQALAIAQPQAISGIIVTLGRIMTSQLQPVASQVLLEFWQARASECDADCRQVLATALGELRDSSGRFILEQLEQDRDRKVQLHAQAALRKLN